jgi:hypothetical protein
MNSKRLTNISNAIENNGAATKEYSEEKVKFKSDVLSINSQYKFINARNNRIKNVGDPIEETDAINKKNILTLKTTNLLFFLTILTGLDFLK